MWRLRRATAEGAAQNQLQGYMWLMRAETSRCDQRTGALHKVSDASGALGVAVGDGRRRRPAECVCVEQQRLQRLQQPERWHLRSRLRIAATHLRMPNGPGCADPVPSLVQLPQPTSARPSARTPLRGRWAAAANTLAVGVGAPLGRRGTRKWRGRAVCGQRRVFGAQGRRGPGWQRRRRGGGGPR